MKKSYKDYVKNLLQYLLLVMLFSVLFGVFHQESGSKIDLVQGFQTTSFLSVFVLGHQLSKDKLPNKDVDVFKI